MSETNVIPNYLTDYLIGRPIPAGGHYIHSWGDDNLYPQMIREITRENGLLQNILNKHFEMLFAGGPQLYETGFSNGRRYKRWVQNKEIEDWLGSWDWLEYLQKAAAEFLMLNGYFTIFHCDTKPFTKSAIDKLEFISCDLARLQWAGTGEPITHLVTGDFTRSGLFGYDRLPMFNPQNPRAQEQSISFEYAYQAGVEFYPRSPIHSSLSWINLESSIPTRLTNFNDNSMAIKYHIEVPALYWEKLRDKLIAECQEKGTVYVEGMLLAAKSETFEEVSNALCGVDKVGKFLATEVLRDELHEKYVGWKVTPLDQRVKDLIDGQLKISHEASFNLSAGLGVHPALAGLQKDGGLSSGSELMVAAKLYKNISVDISEKIIMKNLNTAIGINFAGFKARMGFCHDEI